MAGAIYVLDRARVDLVNVSFAQTVKTISRWGSGMSELVAAMEKLPGRGANDLGTRPLI